MRILTGCQEEIGTTLDELYAIIDHSFNHQTYEYTISIKNNQLNENDIMNRISKKGKYNVEPIK